MDDCTDKAFAKILGQHLRRAREGQGWTRAEIVARMPSGIGERTLLSYEHGIRNITITRFVEIAKVLSVNAAEMFIDTLKEAGDPRGISLWVDLRAVAFDDEGGFRAVQRWAQNRLVGESGRNVHLAPATIRELAIAFKLTHSELANYLAEFIARDSRV